MSDETAPVSEGAAPVGDDTAGAYYRAQQEYRAAREQDEAAPADLLMAAAHAHLDASRPLDVIKAEYDDLLAARDRGEPVDGAMLQELAHELSPVREAAENLAGNLPGAAHAAATSVGGES